MAELVRALAWRPGGPGFKSCCGNFSSELLAIPSVDPALPVSFGGDTKSRRSLLSGVYARGSKRSHQSAAALEMCNLLWTLHSSLEKDVQLSKPLLC